MGSMVVELESLANGRTIKIRRAKPTAAVVVQFLAHANFHGLDPVLVPTDRMMERWAVSQGSDDYRLKWQDGTPKSRPPPLDEDTAVIVDRIVMHAPIQTSNFAKRWYLRPNEPPAIMARDLGIHPDNLEMRWHSTLWALRREFIAHDLDV